MTITANVPVITEAERDELVELVLNTRRACRAVSSARGAAAEDYRRLCADDDASLDSLLTAIQALAGRTR